MQPPSPTRNSAPKLAEAGIRPSSGAAASFSTLHVYCAGRERAGIEEIHVEVEGSQFPSATFLLLRVVNSVAEVVPPPGDEVPSLGCCYARLKISMCWQRSLCPTPTQRSLLRRLVFKGDEGGALLRKLPIKSKSSLRAAMDAQAAWAAIWLKLQPYPSFLRPFSTMRVSSSVLLLEGPF